MTRRRIGLMATAVLLLGACSGNNEAEQRRASEAAAASAMPSAPATLPMDATLPEDLAGSAGSSSLLLTGAAFSVASVPITSVSLPPFPFFKDPEGLQNELSGDAANTSFDRHWFVTGNQLTAVEGRLARARFNLENPASGRQYSVVEFQRNYENAIVALGGRRISTTQFTDEVVSKAGGRDAIEKFFNASPPVPDAEHYSYLVRTADKEYWIHISAGGTVPRMGFVTVLEKQIMQSSLAFVDAAAMKKALDTQGRVALYINFDLDKATLRPDAQPVIEEINKLLVSDPALKLSIEGHTDSTGGAAHNRELATSRARSVLGSLVGLGIDPARLGSVGFGPDKPIADNATDDGRAKNRRVELVKTN